MCTFKANTIDVLFLSYSHVSNSTLTMQQKLLYGARVMFSIVQMSVVGWGYVDVVQVLIFESGKDPSCSVSLSLSLSPCASRNFQCHPFFPLSM
jgi:hypothetical protein